MSYACPICDYPDLAEEPYYTYEICPRCHIEFGIEDAFPGPDGHGHLAKDSAERKEKLQELREKYLRDGPFA